MLNAVMFTSCKKHFNSSITAEGKDGIQPFSFNWETVDWMPTPAVVGQSLINPPWIGQGSITSIYGIDVVNDHKASDGWVLVYNTFNPNSPGPLQNPYFILYNKYRGLMRIYFYVTSPISNNSDYLVDGLTASTTGTTSLLNFLGNDIVDVSQNQLSYSQIEPGPPDGSAPLATRKWYMLQYELAYDPNIANTNYNNIQLSWYTNYNSISKISLGGPLIGSVNGTVGSSTSNINSSLLNGVDVVTTAGLSLAGSSAVNNASGNFSGVNPIVGPDGTITAYTPTTMNNKLGLSNETFTALQKGLNSAFSAATGNIPGAVAGLLSAIIGGSSSAQTVSLTLNAKLQLDGTSASRGSFPASPASVYVPGTIIDPIAAQGYIPLYANSLGIFNLSSKPIVNVNTTSIKVNQNGGTYYQYNNLYTVNTSSINYLWNSTVINSTSTGASIKNLKTEVVLIDPDLSANPVIGGNIGIIGTHTVITGSSVGTTYTVPRVQPRNNYVAVRITFDVVPNNGTTPKSTIIKTFLANLVNN
ncbi:hypothetical protein [Hydrotalea sp.]|uniref:hypothetical protein n=1 Tax=Hydrotalea sp. TaxID=2881279 RepID=UPI0026113C0B|nr:hypothetical protein [Hydrotalea sp.]